MAWSGDRKPYPQTGKVPAVGNTVDVKDASYTNTIGAVERKKVWTDPEVDPSEDALLLRASNSDSDAEMEHLRCQEVGSSTSYKRPVFHSRTCVDFADLVHAGTAGCGSRYQAKLDGCRPPAKGRSGAQ